MEDKLQLIDRHSNVLCRINSPMFESSRMTGKIEETNFPDQLSKLLSEYDNAINDIVLSVLDDMQDKVLAYGLAIKFQNKVLEIKHIHVTGEEEICVDFSNPLDNLLGSVSR